MINNVISQEQAEGAVSRFDVNISAPSWNTSTLKPLRMVIYKNRGDEGPCSAQLFLFDKRGRVRLHGKSRSHSKKILRERNIRSIGFAGFQVKVTSPLRISTEKPELS